MPRFFECDRVPTLVEDPRVFPAPIRQSSVLLSAGDTAADFPIALPPELRDARPSRRLHYAAGRYCARRALEALDPPIPESSVGRGEAGEPLWPAGIVGSITHSGAFVSAAAARAKDARGVGIDTQELVTTERMTLVMPTVLLASEAQRATASALGPGVWTTIAFCAKEALFKCLYPLAGVRFYYTAAEVTSIDTDSRTFRITLTEAVGPEFDAGMAIDGRFELSREYVHAGIWLWPARSGQS
jgi:enterobactin synthetase component D